MARRFDQYYQVKPRDNLGDPEYWNRRFDDIDRRVSSNEDGLDSIGGLTAYVEGLALDRLDLVLAPALDKITLVSQQGFLLAHSDSSVTLDTTTTQVFAIPDQAERELFAPSPFVTIVRKANMTDYAFAQLIDWNKVSGQLTLKPLQIVGNSGPFDDWIIYVGTAISEAIQAMLSQTMAARDATVGYRDASAVNAAATAADRSVVNQAKSDTFTARDAAAASAAAAATWDPSFYIAKNAAGTYTQTITFSMSPLVPTATLGDNSQKAASTGFVAAAISALVAGSPAALDTLNELSNALGADANFSATISASLGNRLRFDAAQALTGAQQTQAQSNIGLVKTTAAQIWANSADNVVTNAAAWAAAGWVNLGNVSGSVVINGNAGSRFYGTLVGAITISATNMKSGQILELAFLQDGAGGHTISWSGIYFPDGVAPTVYTPAGNWALFFSGFMTWAGVLTGSGWKIN
jgi:hypothetical protein